MSTSNEIMNVLFGGANPGGKFLLCLAVYLSLIFMKDHFKSKMIEIARSQDPTLLEDSPFSRIVLQNTEVWTNPEWRNLKTKHSYAENLSYLPFLLGMWFGFESTILILGNLLNW